MRIPVIAPSILLALVSAANGETSSRLAAAKPAETYSYFKQRLGSLGAGSKEARFLKEDSFIPLTSCNDAPDYIGYDGDENSVLERTANLAYDVLYLQAVLQAAGYPEAAWRSDLTAYESSNLAAVEKFKIELTEEGSPAKRRLAAKLNDYNAKSGARYKKLVPQADGCGAGEVDVKIRTTPSAQRVQYINAVKYDLCSFQGLDPKGASCDLWTDYSAGSGDGAQMSGKYKIRVTWSDGTTVFRDLNVDDLVEDRNGHYSFAISRR